MFVYAVIRTEYFNGELDDFNVISVFETRGEAIKYIEEYANSMGDTSNNNGVFTSKQGDSLIQLYYNAVPMLNK